MKDIVIRIVGLIMLLAGVVMKIQSINYAYLVMGVGIFLSLFVNNEKFSKKKKN